MDVTKGHLLLGYNNHVITVAAINKARVISSMNVLILHLGETCTYMYVSGIQWWILYGCNHTSYP